MQPLAGSVEQQHQRSGTCQQRAAGIGLGDQQHKALHQRAQGGQNGKAVRRGGLGKPRKTGHKGAPVGGTGNRQQRQRHAGIDRRQRQRTGHGGQCRSQNAQRQQRRGGCQRDKAGGSLARQPGVKLALHGRGILGTLVFVSVGNGQLGGVEGLGDAVRGFVRRGAAQMRQRQLAAQPGKTDKGICPLLCRIGCGVGQAGGGAVKAGGVPAGGLAVDGLRNVVDKACRVVRRGGRGKILRKAGVGRGGLRRLGERRQLAGQAVHQTIHVIGGAVGGEQAGHIGGFGGSRRRLRLRLRCRGGLGCRGFGLRLAAGTHGIVGCQKLLGVAAGRRNAQLLGKARGVGRGDRLARRLPGGIPGRRGCADLLVQDKFHGVALFAVDRAGGAGVVLFGGVRQGGAQHLQRLRRGGGLGGAGVFAVPDIAGVLGLHGRLVHGRGCGRLRPREHIPQGGAFVAGGRRGVAFHFGRGSRGGFRGRLGIGEVFLRGGRVSRGILLRVGGAEGDVDGNELLGLLGAFKAEPAALFLARFADAPHLVGDDGGGFPEKFLELVFALVQRLGTGSAAFGRHLDQKALDDAGVGGVTTGVGRRSGLAGRHGLPRGGRLGGGCLCGRLGRSAAGCGLRRRGGARRGRVLQLGKNQVVGRNGGVVQRCRRYPHAAQDLVDLVVGHRFRYTGCGLLHAQLLQDAIHRIVSTFARHSFDSL